LTSRIRQSFIAPALVALALAVPASAQTPSLVRTGPLTALPAPVVDLSKIAIANFGALNPAYYRGAQPQGSDYRALAVIGIKTVIDLQADGDAHEASDVQQAGMKYVRIPMTTHVAPTAAQIAEFLKVVGDPASQPVYVHCAGGRHRTGVMTAIYRMTHDGWTGKDAFAEMKRYHFGADFLHSEFKDFVLGYHAPAALATAAHDTEPAQAR
jgi:protein tyrosine/serine phosphatase